MESPSENGDSFGSSVAPNGRRDAPTSTDRPTALLLLGASVAFAIAYSLIDVVVLKSSLGAWPLLIVTFILSIVSAIVAKDVVFSPLCCLAATIIGLALVATFRSVLYVQFHFGVPLALAFSSPSLIVVLIRRRLIVQFSTRHLFATAVTVSIFFACWCLEENMPDTLRVTLPFLAPLRVALGIVVSVGLGLVIYFAWKWAIHRK